MKRFFAGLLVAGAGAYSLLAQTPSPNDPAPAASPPISSGSASSANNGFNAGDPSHYQEPGIVFESNFNSTAIFTASAEYLLWYFPDQNDPIVIADDGSLEKRTLAAVRDQSSDGGMWPGVQVSLGYWFLEPSYFMPNAGIRTFGVETKFFVLGERSRTAQNDTSPTIIRPFFDLNSRQESGFVVAAPGLATGSIAARSEMSMWGAEFNFWKNVGCVDPYNVCSVSVMAGYRFMEMDPQIEIHQTTVFNQNLAAFPAFLPFAGNRLQVNDVFAVRNRFNGGQLGVRGTVLFERFTLDGTFKLALGCNEQEIHIEGNQLRTLANGTNLTSPAGVLALASNSGRYQQNKFSQIPELNLGLSCPILSCLTLRFDFTAFYWSKILRAGEQIDKVIDVTQIPNDPLAAGAVPTGLGRPMVPFAQSGLWVLGVGLGAEVKW
jgi:hypothetical protein